MVPVPIVVHRPVAAGGRPVTVRDKLLGVAHSDSEVVGLLRGAGWPFGPSLLDNPVWVRWAGAPAHSYGRS